MQRPWLMLGDSLHNPDRILRIDLKTTVNEETGERDRYGQSSTIEKPGVAVIVESARGFARLAFLDGTPEAEAIRAYAANLG